MSLLARYRTAYVVGVVGLGGFLGIIVFLGADYSLNGPAFIRFPEWGLFTIGWVAMIAAYLTRCPGCRLSLLRSSVRSRRVGRQTPMTECAGCGYDFRQGPA